MAIDNDISEFFDEDDFAESAVYTALAGGVTPDISVIVQHGVELVSQNDAEMSEVRTVISLQASQVPSPKRDDTIETEQNTYSVDRKISDDGSLIEVSVN